MKNANMLVTPANAGVQLVFRNAETKEAGFPLARE
jgi:hypothetical protein